MNKKIKEISLHLIVILIMFVSSFCEFSTIYFVLSIPLISAITIFNNKYFFSAYLGLVLASIAIPGKTPIIVITASLCLGYILSLLLSNFRLKPAYHITIVGAFMGLFLSLMFHFAPMKASYVNVVLIPVISAFLTYNLSLIVLGLKSKESFSLRKNELAFVGFMIVAILFNLDIYIINFRLNVFLIMIAIYLLARIDTTAVIITALSLFVFKVPNEEYLRIFLVVAPSIFIYNPIWKNKYFGFLIYAASSGFLMLVFKDYTYLIEIIPAIIVMSLINERSINQIKKYIIEPQDYQLKLFQKSYYRCMSRNKKIQSVLQVLENKISTDKKMKQNNKNIITKNICFLHEKIKDEDNIYLKDAILNELNYKKADVVGLKIFSDLLENYKIIIEVKNSKIDEEEITNILEKNLQVKLKKEEYYYDYIIHTHRYTFANEQKLRFNVNIKQRSKEDSCCGDSYLTFDIKNKKYLLISDGMGHGKKASRESLESLNLLKSLIELGINAKDAIECCNALLFEKNKENFNTLDLLEYDSYENEFYLYKNGSGNTYLKTGRKVEKITSENLPLGIIEKINVEKIKLENDVNYIVLTSDGLKKDFSEVLSKSKARSAKALTNEIINYEGEIIEDDQTIMVINVIQL